MAKQRKARNMIVTKIPKTRSDMEHKPPTIPQKEHGEDLGFDEVFRKELGRNEDATTQIKSIFAGI